MSKIKVAAITSALSWQYRGTCSGERYDAQVAQRYVAEQTDRALALLDKAAAAGAELVLGHEYLFGSEMFITTPENQLALLRQAGARTVERASHIARTRGAYIAICGTMLHGDRPAMTAVLIDRSGNVVGKHVKRKSENTGLWPASPALFNLDRARAGFLICSDVTDDPIVPLDMSRRGMNMLLVPGIGFAGKLWREFIIVRSRDCQCAVVHADENHAAIVDSEGNVLAETDKPDTFIVADVELPARA